MTKDHISQAKKNEVWYKYYRGQGDSFVCFCCKGTISRRPIQHDIYSPGFSCGHILAESKGGTLDVENLRPLCISCNSSMRTTHMFEFMINNCMKPPINDSHFEAYKAAHTRQSRVRSVIFNEDKMELCIWNESLQVYDR